MSDENPELVERVATVAQQAWHGGPKGRVVWEDVARAVLAEIAKSDPIAVQYQRSLASMHRLLSAAEKRVTELEATCRQVAKEGEIVAVQLRSDLAAVTRERDEQAAATNRAKDERDCAITKLREADAIIAEVRAAFRKHNLAAGPTAIDRLVQQRDSLTRELAEAKRGDPDGHLLAVYQVLTDGAGTAADLFGGEEPRYGRVVERAKLVLKELADTKDARDKWAKQCNFASEEAASLVHKMTALRHDFDAQNITCDRLTDELAEAKEELGCYRDALRQDAPSDEELVQLFAQKDPVHWATDDRYRGVRRVWDSGYTRGFAAGRGTLDAHRSAKTSGGDTSSGITPVQSCQKIPETTDPSKSGPKAGVSPVSYETAPRLTKGVIDFSNPENRYPWEEEDGTILPFTQFSRCRGCGADLDEANRCIADGCPCNSPRGVNHGIVPRNTCTCQLCDPTQSGSTRVVRVEPEKAPADEGPPRVGDVVQATVIDMSDNDPNDPVLSDELTVIHRAGQPEAKAEPTPRWPTPRWPTPPTKYDGDYKPPGGFGPTAPLEARLVKRIERLEAQTKRWEDWLLNCNPSCHEAYVIRAERAAKGNDK